MVTYIPGPEQLLAPAAQEITEGVLNFLNPNRQFQKAVQASIAQNPDVAQHFANLEATSPGILRSMGIGRLASISPTPQAEYEAKNRSAVLGQMEAETSAKTAGNLYSGDQFKRAMQLFQQDPSIGMDAALKMATGETAAERTVNKLQQQRAQAGMYEMANNPDVARAAGVAAATGARPGQLAEEQLQEQAMQEAQKLLQYGPDVTLQKFLKGEYTNKQLFAIASTPFWKTLNDQMDYLSNQARVSLMSGRGDDAMERLLRGEAFTLYGKLNDPSITVEDVYKALTDPEFLKGGSGVDAGKPGTANDSASSRIRAGVLRLQAGQVAPMLKGIQSNLTALYGKYAATLNKGTTTAGVGGDALRSGIVDDINNELDRAAMFPGQERYRASYEVVPRGMYGFNPSENAGLFPRFDKKELVFHGPDNKVVDFSAILNSTRAGQAPPAPASGTAPGNVLTPGAKTDTAKKGYSDATIKKAVDIYNKAQPGQRAALLKQWELESPADAAKIKALLGVK